MVQQAGVTYLEGSCAEDCVDIIGKNDGECKALNVGDRGRHCSVKAARSAPEGLSLDRAVSQVS